MKGAEAEDQADVQKGLQLPVPSYAAKGTSSPRNGIFVWPAFCALTTSTSRQEPHAVLISLKQQGLGFRVKPHDRKGSLDSVSAQHLPLAKPKPYKHTGTNEELWQQCPVAQNLALPDVTSIALNEG